MLQTFFVVTLSGHFNRISINNISNTMQYTEYLKKNHVITYHQYNTIYRIFEEESCYNISSVQYHIQNIRRRIMLKHIISTIQYTEYSKKNHVKTCYQ
ncbi:uncharacterized protein LOC144473030 isoform X2 [Augochlora pura]